jgi:hypothetical protein
MERRSFNRACAALAMTTRGSTGHRAPAEEVLRANWRDDDRAGQILKAATSPATTQDFAAIQSTKFVQMLAPDCAAAKLLNLGYKFDLTGINLIKLPFVGGSGRPAQPVFIAEGAPAPVPELTTSSAILGPTCKVLVQSAITGELQSASAQAAEEIVGMALAISTAQSLDSQLFSSNAAVAGVSPAGILHGITPVISAGGAGGAAGCATDLAALAAEIGAAGVSIDDMVIVTTPVLATKIHVLAGPHFDDRVFSSSYLPSGMLIGIVPQGLASGYAGRVDVETSIGATIVTEDTSPPPIGSPGTPPTVGAPTLSALQSYLVVIKVRARMAWCVQPACVAAVSGASW